MLRRTSLCLMIALALGACSDSTAPERPVDPSALRLQIVSGDRQTAPVAAAPTVSGAALIPGLSLQTLPDNLLPEPLVARIVVDGEPLKSLSTPSAPLGPSLVTLPSDVVVTYRVIQPTGVGQRHCGDSFISSAKPDADGLVTTYWERGTYAGECRMEVRLVIDGEPRVDTVFVAEFEPGVPVKAVWGGSWESDAFTAGDTIDLSEPITGGTDAHGNPTTREAVVSAMQVYTEWTPGWSCPTITVGVGESPGEGWRVVAPDAEDWPVSGYSGHNACLHVWLSGQYVNKIQMRIN